MRRFTQTVVATAGGISYSKPYIVDTYRNPCNIGVGVSIIGAGSAVYTVQHSFDDPFAIDLGNPVNGTWLNNDFLAAATTGDDTNYAFPPTAIRLAVASAASAQATMTIIQAGPE